MAGRYWTLRRKFENQRDVNKALWDIQVGKESGKAIPISVLINYLEQYVENIIFIGIQPKCMSGEICKNVKKSGDEIIKIIKNDNLEQIKILQK